MKPKTRACDVLLRLEGRRLDEARAAVRDASERLESAEARRAAWLERAAREGRTHTGNAELGPWLAAYLDAARAEANALGSLIEQLRHEHRAKVDGALRARIEYRRLELLAARAHRRSAYEEGRREERELGQLICQTRARPNADP